jgi:hypothetical protein
MPRYDAFDIFGPPDDDLFKLDKPVAGGTTSKPPSKGIEFNIGEIDNPMNFASAAEVNSNPYAGARKIWHTQEGRNFAASAALRTGMDINQVRAAVEDLYGTNAYYTDVGGQLVSRFGSTQVNGMSMFDTTLSQIQKYSEEKFGRPYMSTSNRPNQLTGEYQNTYAEPLWEYMHGQPGRQQIMQAGRQITFENGPTGEEIQLGDMAIPGQAISHLPGYYVDESGMVVTGSPGSKAAKRMKQAELQKNQLTFQNLPTAQHPIATQGGGQGMYSQVPSVTILGKGAMPEGQSLYDPNITGAGIRGRAVTVTLPDEIPADFQPSFQTGQRMELNRNRFDVAPGISGRIAGANAFTPESWGIAESRKVLASGESTMVRKLVMQGQAEYGGVISFKTGGQKTAAAPTPNLSEALNLRVGDKPLRGIAHVGAMNEAALEAYSGMANWTPEKLEAATGERTWGPKAAKAFWESEYGAGNIQMVTMTQGMYLGQEGSKEYEPQLAAQMKAGFANIVQGTERVEGGARFGQVDVTYPALIGTSATTGKVAWPYHSRLISAEQLEKVEAVDPNRADAIRRYSQRHNQRAGDIFGAQLATEGLAPNYPAVSSQDVTSRWSEVSALSKEMSRRQVPFDLREGVEGYGEIAHTLRAVSEISGGAGIEINPEEHGLKGDRFFMPNPTSMISMFGGGEVEDQLFGIPKTAYNVLSGLGSKDRTEKDTARLQRNIELFKKQMQFATSSPESKRELESNVEPRIGGQIQSLESLAPAELWIPEQRMTEALEQVWGMGEWGANYGDKYSSPQEAAQAILMGKESMLPNMRIGRWPINSARDVNLQARPITYEQLKSRLGRDISYEEANAMGVRASMAAGQAGSGDWDEDPRFISLGTKNDNMSMEQMNEAMIVAAREAVGQEQQKTIEDIMSSPRSAAEAYERTVGSIKTESLSNIARSTQEFERNKSMMGPAFNATERAIEMFSGAGGGTRQQQRARAKMSLRIQEELGAPMYMLAQDATALPESSRGFIEQLSYNAETKGFFKRSALGAGGERGQPGRLGDFVSEMSSSVLGMSRELGMSPDVAASLLADPTQEGFQDLVGAVESGQPAGVVRQLGRLAGVRGDDNEYEGIIGNSPAMRMTMAYGLEKAARYEKDASGKRIDRSPESRERYLSSLTPFQQRLHQEGSAVRGYLGAISRGPGAKQVPMGEYVENLQRMVGLGLMSESRKETLANAFVNTGVMKGRGVASSRSTAPGVVSEAAEFLKSVPGIGEKTAQSLVGKFGGHLPTILANEQYSGMLQQARGIGPTRAAAIQAAYRSQYGGGLTKGFVTNPETGEVEPGMRPRIEQGQIRGAGDFATPGENKSIDKLLSAISTVAPAPAQAAASSPVPIVAQADKYADIERSVLGGFGSFREMAQSAHAGYQRGTGISALRRELNASYKSGDVGRANDIIDWAKSQGLSFEADKNGIQRAMWGQYLGGGGGNKPPAPPPGDFLYQEDDDNEKQSRASGTPIAASNRASNASYSVPAEITRNPAAFLREVRGFTEGKDVLQQVHSIDAEGRTTTYNKRVSFNVNEQSVERLKAGVGADENFQYDDTEIFSQVRDVMGKALTGHTPESKDEIKRAGWAGNVLTEIRAITGQAAGAERLMRQYQEEAKNIESHIRDTQGEDAARAFAAEFGDYAQRSHPVSRSVGVAFATDVMQNLGIPHEYGAVAEAQDKLKTLRKKGATLPTKVELEQQRKAQSRSAFGSAFRDMVQGNLDLKSRTQALAFAEKGGFGEFGGILADLAEGKRFSDSDIRNVIREAPEMEGAIEDYMATGADRMSEMSMQDKTSGLVKRALAGSFRSQESAVNVAKAEGLGSSAVNLITRIQSGSKLTQAQQNTVLGLGLSGDLREYQTRLGSTELNWLNRASPESLRSAGIGIAGSAGQANDFASRILRFFGMSRNEPDAVLAGQGFTSQDQVDATLRGAGYGEEDIVQARGMISSEAALAQFGGRANVEQLRKSAAGIVSDFRRTRAGSMDSWRDATSRKRFLERKGRQYQQISGRLEKISEETGLDVGIDQESSEFMESAMRAKEAQASVQKEILNAPGTGGMFAGGEGRGLLSGRNTLQNELVELNRGMLNELKAVHKYTQGMDESTKKLAERETTRTGLREFDRIINEARDIGGEAGVAKLLASKESRKTLQLLEGDEPMTTKIGLGVRKLFSPMSPEGAMMRAFWRMGVGEAFNTEVPTLGRMGMQELGLAGMLGTGGGGGGRGGRAPGLSSLAEGGAAGELSISEQLGPMGTAAIRASEQAANRRSAAEISELAWGWTQGTGSADKFKAFISPSLSFGVGAGQMLKTMGFGGIAGAAGMTIGLGAMGMAAMQYGIGASRDNDYNKFSALREQSVINDPNANILDKAWAWTSGKLRDMGGSNFGLGVESLITGRFRVDSTGKSPGLSSGAGGELPPTIDYSSLTPGQARGIGALRALTGISEFGQKVIGGIVGKDTIAEAQKNVSAGLGWASSEIGARAGAVVAGTKAELSFLQKGYDIVERGIGRAGQSRGWEDRMREIAIADKQLSNLFYTDIQKPLGEFALGLARGAVQSFRGAATQGEPGEQGPQPSTRPAGGGFFDRMNEFINGVPQGDFDVPGRETPGLASGIDRFKARARAASAGTTYDFALSSSRLMSGSFYDMTLPQRAQATNTTVAWMRAANQDFKMYDQSAEQQALTELAAYTGYDLNRLASENKIEDKQTAGLVMAMLNNQVSLPQAQGLSQATGGGTAGTRSMADFIMQYKANRPGTPTGFVETAIQQFAPLQQYGWSSEKIASIAGAAGEQTGMGAINLQRVLGGDQRTISQLIMGKQMQLDTTMAQGLAGQYQLQSLDRLGMQVGMTGELGNLTQGIRQNVNAEEIFRRLSTPMYSTEMARIQSGASFKQAFTGREYAGTAIDMWGGESILSLQDTQRKLQLEGTRKQRRMAREEFAREYGAEYDQVSAADIAAGNWESQGFASIEQVGGAFQKQRQLGRAQQRLSWAQQEGGAYVDQTGAQASTYIGQFAFQDRVTALQRTQWQENYALQGQQMRESREFSLMERGWNVEDMFTNRSRGLTQRGWQGADIERDYSRGVTRLDWQAEDLARQGEVMGRGKDYQLWQLGWQERMTGMQRGWQTEDFAFQRSQGQMQYGWQMEDIEENIRFASGRQRKMLLRQKERATTQYNIGEERQDIQEERTSETWKMEDERNAKQREHLLEEIELNEENWQKQLDRLATQRQWLEEDHDTSKERFEEKSTWDDEDWEKQTARFEERTKREDTIYEQQLKAYQRQLFWQETFNKEEDARRKEDRQAYEDNKKLAVEAQALQDENDLARINQLKTEKELAETIAKSADAVENLTSLFNLFIQVNQSGALDNLEAAIGTIGGVQPIAFSGYPGIGKK